MSDTISRTVDLSSLKAHQLKTLLGEYNNHIKYLEHRLSVHIHQRKTDFVISGELDSVTRAERILVQLADEAQSNDVISPEDLHLLVQTSFSREQDLALENNAASENGSERADSTEFTPISLRTRKGKIIPRGYNQQQYVKKILLSDVSFGVGPAGTGKTYLAVACAVDMLERNEIERILLVRPAVEAGENLGFLPGDLKEKIDPYLRPLYDALYDMLEADKIVKLLERNVIEVAPIAFMRGRTLNDAFVILDEAQNTTSEQMKMFLTRLGFGSKAVVTGDVTQIDLPSGRTSGLVEAMKVVGNIEGIAFVQFNERDVVRHSLVQKIVRAYERYGEATGAGRIPAARDRPHETGGPARLRGADAGGRGRPRGADGSGPRAGAARTGRSPPAARSG